MVNKFKDTYTLVEEKEKEAFTTEVAKMNSHGYTLLEFTATDTKYVALMCRQDK